MQATIHKNIKFIRANIAQLNQERFAQQLAIKRSKLVGYELGYTKKPDETVVKRIATMYGFTLNELYEKDLQKMEVKAVNAQQDVRKIDLSEDSKGLKFRLRKNTRTYMRPDATLKHFVDQRIQWHQANGTGSNRKKLLDQQFGVFQVLNDVMQPFNAGTLLFSELCTLEEMEVDKSYIVLTTNQVLYRKVKKQNALRVELYANNQAFKETQFTKIDIQKVYRIFAFALNGNDNHRHFFMTK